MGNRKISDFPNADTIAGTELVAVVQHGISKKTPVSGLKIEIESSNRLLGKLIGADFSATVDVDQLITLSGGDTFVVTDVLITNALPGITTGGSENGEIWSDTHRSGEKIMQSNVTSENLWLLETPDKFINNNSALFNYARQLVTEMKVVSNEIYFSIGVPNSVPATGDIYVFGFILN